MLEENGSFEHSYRAIWLEISKKSLPEQLTQIIQEGGFFPSNDYFRVSMPLEENEDSYFFRIEFSGKQGEILRFSFNGYGWNNIIFRLLTEKTEYQRHGAKFPENVAPVVLGESWHCICNQPKNCNNCPIDINHREIYIFNYFPNHRFILTRVNTVQ